MTLSSDKAALWVWLETSDDAVQVADGFFHLQPGHSHTVAFSLNQPGMDKTAIQNALRVHSLYDTYA
ncbi:MAG: hypothetical protein IPL78_05065 [Chloroflexi bacterium]|nr:hypothetical protein [Chloroflexota bacterium]